MPTKQLTTPEPPGTPHPTDYESVFDSFNHSMSSGFGSPAQPTFSTQTAQFLSQNTHSASTNLGLERLALGESPTGKFMNASQGSSPPGFRDFDAALANFTGSMPIETMLDVTAMGQPAYVPGVVTEQTARLMRHYIDNLASWMDLSDSRNHFSTVVPKRALTSV